LKWFACSLASFAAIQLIVLWVLYLNHKPDISTKVLAALVPLFFSLIFVSLLLPRLSKFKIGGVTAEVGSTGLEHPEEFNKGVETTAPPPSASNIAPASGQGEKPKLVDETLHRRGRSLRS
jgi:hypothetical protein